MKTMLTIAIRDFMARLASECAIAHYTFANVNLFIDGRGIVPIMLMCAFGRPIDSINKVSADKILQ